MNGIFKFIQKSPSIEAKPSRRCFPEKLYGVSQQSPKQFKLSNTLVNFDGYIWKQPQVHYLSELRHNSVVGNLHLPSTFSNEHKKRLENQQFSFRRRKGLLSQFLDNHAWKNKVIPLLGAQRNKQGRRIRNNQYQKIKKATLQKHSSLHHNNCQYSFIKNRSSFVKQEQSSLDGYLNSQDKQLRRVKTKTVTPMQNFQKYISKVSSLNNTKLVMRQNSQVTSTQEARKLFSSSFQPIVRKETSTGGEQALRKSLINKRGRFVNRQDFKKSTNTQNRQSC